MIPAATLGAYTGALALAFGAAVGIGSAVGPVGTAGAAGADSPSHSGSGASHGGEHGRDDQTPARTTTELTPSGLAVSQDGYTLQLARTVQTPGSPGRLDFAIAGPDGQAVTQYTPQHDKELHLIVVRRDLTGFQHLHPERDAHGAWSVPLTLPTAGPYKVFVDFVPADREDGLTLAADLTAPGAYTPQPPTTGVATTRTASVDGYDVTLAGDLVAGTSSKLTLSVARDGRPVTDLQPYLAAYGHLVALRDGDLAYLHVHPDGDPGDAATRPGPDITFYADVPSAATYQLFLDFQHDGVVRTAAFTTTAAPTDTPATPSTETPATPGSGTPATPSSDQPSSDADHGAHSH